MLGTHPLVTPVAGVISRLREWPVTAQQQARRNAMVAATACAQRRIEREDVADFLREHARPSDEQAASRAADLDRARAAARAHG